MNTTSIASSLMPFVAASKTQFAMKSNQKKLTLLEPSLILSTNARINSSNPISRNQIA